MTTCEQKSAITACRKVLLCERDYNVKHGIWPSVNVVINRMLDRELELVDAYIELHQKLSGHHNNALHNFFDALLSTTTLWNPEKIDASRRARKYQQELNEQISKSAAELAELLEKRDKSCSGSGFSSNHTFHLVDLASGATTNASHYTMFLKPKLADLARQYDLKYWPLLQDILKFVSGESSKIEITATDPITEAAATKSRSSKADFFKALFAAIDEWKQAGPTGIPHDFELSDASVADLGNCALGLKPEKLVGAEYIKNLRHREAAEQ